MFHLGVDGGVMITASHNPAEDNGFKIMCGKATIYGADIQKLRERIERRAFRTGVAPGTATDHDILQDYVDTIADNIKLGPRRFKLVVDGGNGTGGLAILPIAKRLGLDVDAIYCDPDGRFPNHHPDPTVPENLADLIARVKATGAEMGIALDGDADRVGAVDGEGRIIWGDQLVMLFAREILQRQPGATFVSEVKCSQALYDDIAARGGKADHVEGRPLADQGEDEGREGRAGRRDVGPHVLRRSLVRLRRRRLRRPAPDRAADPLGRRRWPSSTTRCRSCTTRPRSACPAPTT